MRRCIVFFLFLMVAVCSPVTAQQQLAYSFGETPQTLMLNPGAETNFKYHYGIPVFSNFSFSAGIKGFDLSELFLQDNVDFKIKFEEVLGRLEETDYINFNLRFDVLNGGYRYDDKTYLSFGFYEEVDFTFYMPVDIIELGYYGNSRFQNRPFSLEQIVMKADVLGVLHAGISRKINKRLNVGARVKIYSSSLNVETNQNSGTFTTTAGDENLLQQSLNNVNAEVRTSGLVDADNQFLDNASGLLTNTFLGGNLGLGFDFGMTYHFTPQIEFTASILDFGFVRHTSNTRIYTAQGDYDFDGINFQYDPDNPRDYWQELEDDFDQNIPTTDNPDPYTSWRPTRINAAVKYSFGDIRTKECYTETYKRYYFTSIGALINTVMRPRGPQTSLTGFFDTSITPKFHTRATYTINEFSSTIFGGGFTFQWGKVNVFGTMDNVLGARDLLSANNISFNFGINMVIE